MDLLITPVPLFDKEMSVEAYYFRLQKGNDIIHASRATGILDGAMNSPAFEMLNAIGLEAFTMGKPIFVPVTNYMLLAGLERQCSQPPDKVIFLLDGEASVDEPYINAMTRIKGLGYRFGIQKITNAEVYAPILKLCDYIFLDHRIFDHAEQLRLRFDIVKMYRHLSIVFTHVHTMDIFQVIKGKYAGLFEGQFYRMPITKGPHAAAPLQTNLIQLLNSVRDEHFEFEDVAKIIQRDTALTISLLRLVNSPAIGAREKIKTISHAVTMLGQQEVRKWVTTAVSKMLGADKPAEITRLSLIRAKMCEALAPKFNMRAEAGGLFLMGLFSVLDAILERPMEEALGMVLVSDAIREALVEQKGPYYPVYQFILQYEGASWNAVSRTLIVRDIAAGDVYSAYTEALCWYRNLIEGQAEEEAE
ncbi:MAG: HDOD domain-containing protein [Oscillospiraceae bacterium]|nr:HDOD domain-containing protein [Oscillospiraceae bacterium]